MCNQHRGVNHQDKRVLTMTDFRPEEVGVRTLLGEGHDPLTEAPAESATNFTHFVPTDDEGVNGSWAHAPLTST
jgi:hypothetical protein